jgi:xanthine/CO dehydrogenase XdhC/CoxF family maturation factor
VGEDSTSERLPGELFVGEQPGERALDQREAVRGPAQSSELFEDVCPPRRRVEVGGERADGASVELELPTGVPARRQQEHRATQRGVQLVLGQLEVGARHEGNRDEAFVLAARGEHLLDLREDVAHAGEDTISPVKEVIADVERWRSRGEAVALATVVATRRSAPRPIGSKLAVSERGEMAGSISGGCVEGDVAERAKEVLAGADPLLLTYGIADDEAFEVGLPCGGEIDIWLERLET